MNTRAITEGAMMAALTVIIALLSFYIPFLSVLVYFLIALPTVVLYRRYGLLAAFLEGLTASLLLLLFMDFFNALIYGVNILIPGLTLGYVYDKQDKGVVRFCAGYVAFLLSLIAEMIVFQVVTGTSMAQDFLNEVGTSITTVKDLYAGSGLFSGDELQTLNQNIDALKQTYAMLFPTIVLVIPAALSYIDLLICDHIMKRLRLPFYPMQPITQWKLPPYSEIVIAAAYVIAGIVSSFNKDPNVQIYTTTITYIVLIISWIMGLSFYFWLIQEKTGKPKRFFRFLIILLGLLFPICSSILVITGILDMFFHFRKYFVKNKNE